MDQKRELQILIVEDEAILAFTMKEMLIDIGHEYIKIANTRQKALLTINSNSIDLAILDINLGNEDDGIEIAKQCLLKDIPFFYVTSYTDQKTMDLALETAPGAYIIKPILPSNLYSALRISLNKKTQTTPNYFTFKDGTEHIRLNIMDINYIKADGMYVVISTDNKNHLYRGALIKVCEKLPRDVFVQTHRSYFINMHRVNKIVSNSVFIRDEAIPISRTFRSELKKKLSNS